MFKPVFPNVDFPQAERRILQDWKKFKIVEKYLKKNKLDLQKTVFPDFSESKIL